MGVVLVLRVAEVVGDDDPPTWSHRVEGAPDQPAGPIRSLGAAHVTEHDQVVGRLLDVDLVVVARSPFATFGDIELRGLAFGDLQDGGVVVDDCMTEWAGGQHGDGPRRAAGAEIEDPGMRALPSSESSSRRVWHIATSS